GVRRVYASTARSRGTIFAEVGDVWPVGPPVKL
ncbi:MAG: hypothetical protein ACI9DC_005424, partial [Gammaproteobacteria bacterium]